MKELEILYLIAFPYSMLSYCLSLFCKNYFLFRKRSEESEREEIDNLFFFSILFCFKQNFFVRRKNTQADYGLTPGSERIATNLFRSFVFAVDQNRTQI